MLEFRHLETLIAVAEAGSMASAARRVSLTQSALSHQIKAIEEHYGCPFFSRRTSPVRWSPVGERLVALAYEVQRTLADAEHDVTRIREGEVGRLRIAVECHSCFEWLMPAMDRFRTQWESVELDLVSGFHPAPVDLLSENRADLVIVSSESARPGIEFHPLFRYEMLGILAKGHELEGKKHLLASDFAPHTLITYPIPDQRLDLLRQLLLPAGINPERRTAMLTEAILQLVASGRGITALPAWAIQPFLDRRYVIGRPITKKGLWCQLSAATTKEASNLDYMQDFLKTIRTVCSDQLKGIQMPTTKKRQKK